MSILNLQKWRKLEEFSHEMLVLVLPPVSSRVSGFPVASPCLWGKLQNLSFCHVANCENCRKSRTKCWFFCIHVSCLESLVFLWRGRVYGGSWKTCPFRMFPSRLSCRFAWQAWHFVTFQPLHTPHFTLHTLRSTLHTPYFTLHTLHSTLHTPHSTLYTLHSSLHTLHSSLYTPHSSLHTLHSSLYTPHSTLCTLHSSLHTLHSTLHTPHSTLHTLHFTLHTPHSTLYTPHSTLYTLYTPHSTLYTPHSLLQTPHSTLYTFHSTLQTGNKGNMYKTVQINYCRKVLCVTA